MRVLYLSQYFPPEVGATQARAHDMAKALVRAGSTVVMICELPNHPGGRIPAEYRGRLYHREQLDGIEVLRVWIKASPVKTFRTRMTFYLTYFGMAVWAGLWLVRGKIDVIYATSPPLFAGAAGLLLSYLRRTPFVLEVRDAWPAAAVALGELRSPRAIGMARWLERCCYERARRIVTVTGGLCRYLSDQGIPDEKVRLIPNGANIELFYPRPEAARSLRLELGLEDAFVALYAGLHGIAQNMDTILQAAQRLRDDEELVFLMVGEGPAKSELVTRTRELGLQNVRFHDEVPRAKMPAFLSMADVALVPLRRIPLFRGALPTKLFDAWACACPTVVSGEGELEHVIAASGAGLCVEPENAPDLAAAVLEMKRSPHERRAMGANGPPFVKAHYNRAEQGRQLAALLEEMLSEETQA